MDRELETAVFGGGCFWCTEAIFLRLKGVTSVESGYAGGHTENPTWEEVSLGTTGHAESIRIEFDPSQIKYADLLNIFFATHDPTTPNQQGNDIGPEYRSAIFYISEEQKSEAEKFIEQLENENTFENPIVTEVTKLDPAPFGAKGAGFWPAESYHRRYYDSNQNKPYCSLVISPKLAKLRQKFVPLLKPDYE